jgi:hypothetical protein
MALVNEYATAGKIFPLAFEYSLGLVRKRVLMK